MEAARCPLCRASVIDGSPPPTVAAAGMRNNNNNAAAAVAENNGAAPAAAGGEDALFRFSTENILPAWLPLPAFSFEVVRRQPATAEPADDAAALDAVAVGDGAGANANRAVAENAAVVNAEPQQQQSLLRRVLVLAGVIPMSPEEEALALEQLVDMFPQYDRADLVRGLRDRGSAEGVAESILMGGFAAIPRGGGGAEVEG